MRLFVYEHLCASGIFSSLRTEGWAMLSAVVEDFQRIDGCEVWTILDHFCPAPLGNVCHRLGEDRERHELFRDLAGRADATLVIAPETGGVLVQLSRAVLESGGHLLGCSPAAIDLTADKKALGELWHGTGVPTPALLDTPDFPGFPVVLKPRHGAGSQATFLIRDRESWQTCWSEARREFSDEFVVQWFAEGQPASVAFLVGAAAPNIVPLIPAAQHLSDDGRFHYLGGQLPLEPALARRALDLGERAINVLLLRLSAGNALLGYVGVDLVLGADERNDVAMEINPRLTTSYLGLRRLLQGNLAQVLLDVYRGREVGELRWQPGPIRFSASGAP